MNLQFSVHFCVISNNIFFIVHFSEKTQNIFFTFIKFFIPKNMKKEKTCLRIRESGKIRGEKDGNLWEGKMKIFFKKCYLEKEKNKNSGINVLFITF